MGADPIRAAGDSQVRVAGARAHDLFERHARMVYGLCRALLRDPDDADDATQATFVAAYRSLLGGTHPREPAAWLATIARHECATRARARMREPLPLADLEVGHSRGPEAELERKTARRELQLAIAELPERQREAVVLRDLYGLDYAEVGTALGVSVASVESLLFRARRRLRVSLKPLAGGALTVPLAVQEGVAQAIPSFAAAGAAGGGATSATVGVGLLAKLLGGPAAGKVAAGLAAAVAAGSVAVVGVERTARPQPQGPPLPHPVAGPSRDASSSPATRAFVARVATAPVARASSAGTVADEPRGGSGRRSPGESDGGAPDADSGTGRATPGRAAGEREGASKDDGAAAGSHRADEGGGPGSRDGGSQSGSGSGADDTQGEGEEAVDDHDHVLASESGGSRSSDDTREESSAGGSSGRESDEDEPDDSGQGTSGSSGEDDSEHEDDGAEAGSSGKSGSGDGAATETAPA